MTKHKVCVKKVKGFDELEVTFDFSYQNLIVMTGKNGIGKTTLVKAIKQIYDPKVFEETSSLGSLNTESEVLIELHGKAAIKFEFNQAIGALDTRNQLPAVGELIAELPVPYGERFRHYSEVAAIDSDLRANYASSNYENAVALQDFLKSIYGNTARFDEVMQTEIGKNTYYFIPQPGDYYLREDHLSSGEYFLIQLFRFITSGAKFIIIDEVDIALDASAQVRLYPALSKLLKFTECNVILISHSLALMQTTPDGALYYLESDEDRLTLEPRSFGYVKSDLYGFQGFDKYILTEDSVLEGFIDYLIRHFSIKPDYQFKIIGVGGWTQLRTLVEKNELENFFSEPNNVIGVVDKDAYHTLTERYRGRTRIISSVEDVEKYIYLNRKQLLPSLDPPTYQESDDPKKASKSYWKWLTIDKKYSQIDLYKLLVSNNLDESRELAEKIREFLTRKAQ